MIKTELKIEGMACSMCENHINDTLRQNLDIKKVRSSHKTGKVEIISENELDADLLESVIKATGYKLLSRLSEPYEKKGLFRK